MEQFAAIVVIYNKRCEESLTCCALSNMNDIKVLIYDNSTSDFFNEQYCKAKGWTYLGGMGNIGISKAYNTCINHLSKENFDGMVCLFDDDTNIDENYFCYLREAVKASFNKIFVPLIYSANELLSPCILKKGHKVERFCNGQAAIEYAGNDISAINSCMAINMTVFKNYRYDENIFLDGVDHHFVTDMRAQGENITVFEYRCNHNFSGVEHPSKKAAINRFKIYAKDYRYILKNDKLSYFKLVGKRALSLCFKYKTLIFLSYL